MADPHKTPLDVMPVAVLTQLLSAPGSRDGAGIYRVRSAPEVFALASACADSRRGRQLVIMASRRSLDWPVHPSRLASAVGADADVALLDTPSSVTAFADTLPFGVPEGKVRILRTGLAPSDSQDRHPLIQATRDSEILAEAELYVEEGQRLREDVETTRHQNIDREIAAAVANAVRPERQKISDMTAKITDLKRALANAQAALDEEQRPVFADPHAQFRFELHHAWLQATEEGDRNTWPLREWELGPDFLASIDAQQIVDRARVIRACVDVITGRHAEINSRASHKFKPAGAKDRVRDDGAMAWRCAVNVGPSAARLMWWERADGVVELSLVAAHDDFRIT